MKVVGETLTKLTGSNISVEERNLYGRSAFNRFYYAAYLNTREMLAFLDPKLKKTAHKNIPITLRSTLRNRLKTTVNKYYEEEIMSYNDKQRLIHNMFTATEELANMLEQAYDARVIADYMPEVLIQKKSNSEFLLKSHTLQNAQRWPDRASAYCKTITKVSKDLGLV